MMTIREALARRTRTPKVLMGTGFVLFAISLSLGLLKLIVPGFALLLIMPGLALFTGAVLYEGFFIRCPSCNNRMGQVLHQFWSYFSISSEMQFCPFCRVALDSQVNDQKGS